MNGTQSNLNPEGWRGLLVFTLPLCVILSLVGCSHRAQLRPDESFQEARGQFERGELAQALASADQGFQRWHKTQPEWSERFRVLKGEVLVWQGKSKVALEVLEPPPPA